MLTACADQVPVTQPDSSEAASSQVSSVVPIEEGYTKFINGALQGITINDLTTANMLERLKKMGITASVENIKKLDKINLSFDLCFNTTTGATLRLPVNAPIDGNVLGTFNVAWGGISVMDKNTIAISTLEDMRFYDADTLKEQPLRLDLSSFNKKDYYLLGAIRDKTAGIIVPIFLNGIDGFAFYNKDGKLNRIETFDYGEPTNRWFYSSYNNPTEVGHNQVNYQDKLEIVTLDDTYLIFSNTVLQRGDIYYNISKKHIFGQAFPTLDTTNGNRRMVLNNIDLSFGNSDSITVDKNRLALYYENEDFLSGFLFDGKDINPSFGNPNIEDYPGLKYQWNPTKPIVSATCDFCDLTVTLDFDKSMSKLDYKINPEHLEESFATSSDGRYSLHTASRDGAGDVMYSNIVLRDNQTDALRFITFSGGMYGGYVDSGFFRNGEIYVLKFDSLLIYSPDPAAPSPLLTFKMPLGFLEKERVYRYLLTFRRDPTTKEFIILYADIPIDAEANWDAFPFEYACNYMVGFCDKEGNLLRSYDTGQPLLGDQFGFLKMSFHLSSDELTVTGVGGRGFAGLQGVFDLKTYTYTNTLKKDDDS